MKRKNFFASIFSWLMMFSFFTNICCAEEISSHSLTEVLNFFGFADESQQNAFKFICEKAGVNLPENFGVKELLELVDETQINFVNRADKQERWETTNLSWMTLNQTTLKDKFKSLGFVDAVLPQNSHYDAVGILGARFGAMKERIEFVEALLNKGYSFDKLVLLTGERHATIGVDCSEEKIEEIADFFGIEKSKVTETYLFRYLYENSNLKDRFDLVIIDTPQKDGRRPTTQTTVEDFCEWNKYQPEVKDVVFVSGQPHVPYQKAIISEVLNNNKSKLNFEVVGNFTAANSTKTFAGALGSYIWAYMPNCLRTFGLKIKSVEDILLAKKLYEKMPWLYACLPIEAE